MDDLLRLFSVANDRGFLVNNLYQFDNGSWSAGIRSMKTNKKEMFYFQSARGRTPVIAMTEALRHAEGFRPKDYAHEPLYRDGS